MMASTSKESRSPPSFSEEGQQLRKKLKQKTTYVQKYQSNLEDLPEFKGWLKPIEKIKIHTLFTKIENPFRTIADFYLKHEYLQKTATENIQFRNPDNFTSIENIYLGAHIMALISSNNPDLDELGLLEFTRRCLDFYVENCRQIYRFRFSDPVQITLKLLNMISPEEVKSKKHISLAPLPAKFPSLVAGEKLNELDREWRLLRNLNFTNDFDDLDIREFWVKCSKLKLGDDTPMFSTLCIFISGIELMKL
ncbi:hypothetical protein RN001_005675 [Aquatica leii]|uniref:Uncharacterized protein n=1 Tax=Aquatica leii TaxID=1421715 RepID=A0AAN7PHC6_9COLE|nr:hypothetical protein RN001_005675 [Aquatica leii]